MIKYSLWWFRHFEKEKARKNTGKKGRPDRGWYNS